MMASNPIANLVRNIFFQNSIKIRRQSMKMKTLVIAAVSAMMIATAAQAAVEGYFSQGMAASGFEPSVVQKSETFFGNMPVQFSGTMTTQGGTIGGQIQASDSQYIQAGFGGVVISNNTSVQANSGWCGFAGVQTKNESFTSLPFGSYVYTNNQNTAQTFGNASASGTGNTTMVIGH